MLLKDLLSINILFLFASLCSAMGLQYIMSLIPCYLCIVTRYILLFSITCAIIAYAFQRPIFKYWSKMLFVIIYILSIISALIVSIYHITIEKGIKPLIDVCKNSLLLTDITQLISQQTMQSSVDCVVPHYLYNISIASWSAAAMISLLMMLIYCIVYRYMQND